MSAKKAQYLVRHSLATKCLFVIDRERTITDNTLAKLIDYPLGIVNNYIRVHIRNGVLKKQGAVYSITSKGRDLLFSTILRSSYRNKP